MESMQQSEYTDSTPQAPATATAQDSLDINVDKPGALKKLPPANPSGEQVWQEWVQPVTEFLSKLPDYVGEFFSSYQKPLITIGLLISGVVTVKVTLAVLDAINDIPLLAPVFELVGIGYTAWFVYRYLLKVETRQELASEFNSLKSQVVGKDSTNT